MYGYHLKHYHLLQFPICGNNIMWYVMYSLVQWSAYTILRSVECIYCITGFSLLKVPYMHMVSDLLGLLEVSTSQKPGGQACQ